MQSAKTRKLKKRTGSSASQQTLDTPQQYITRKLMAMPTTSSNAAAAKQIGKCTWEKPFPVNGQGTLIFNTDRQMTPFFIAVEDEAGDNVGIALHIGQDFAEFCWKKTDEITQISRIDEPGCGLEKGHVSYWFSYDRDNLVLKYGKGYRMEETTILTYDFLKGAEDQQEIRKEMYPYFNAEGKKHVRQYEELQPGMVLYAIQITEPLVECDKLPFICNLPPFVLDSSKANLFVLDRGEYVLSASLPPACKELYQNILGCDLNYTEEQGERFQLSDAIRYSINTEGCIMYERLKEKTGQFAPDPNETYLRVTLGQSLGNSPGVPYVLEIWPAHHYSPIHNHGNANAIIKVLFNSINIRVHNKFSEASPGRFIKEIVASKDQVTWINRNWYQTHQLKNETADYCATIQCYNYDTGDTTHWPYFDYLSENKPIQEFLPDSDFNFMDMRRKVMAEYRDAMIPDSGSK